MIDLTVDVCVLMSGSNIGGDPKFSGACIAFMKKSLKKKLIYIALDERGKIIKQYNDKLKEGTYGQYWLKQMVLSDRIKPISWNPLDRGTRTALEEAHFDLEDYKYVITAKSTMVKTITTHDKDYSSKVRRIIKNRLGIKVQWPQDCVDCYCK